MLATERLALFPQWLVCLMHLMAFPFLPWTAGGSKTKLWLRCMGISGGTL